MKFHHAISSQLLPITHRTSTGVASVHEYEESALHIYTYPLFYLTVFVMTSDMRANMLCRLDRNSWYVHQMLRVAALFLYHMTKSMWNALFISIKPQVI